MTAPVRSTPPATPASSAAPARTAPTAHSNGAASQPTPELPPWQPTSGRQKLLLMVLTVVTVLGLVYVLQRPHQQLLAVKAARHAAACQAEAASRPVDCPGALMPVLLLPAQARAAR